MMESSNVKTDFDFQDVSWRGMHALNSYLAAPCVPQVSWWTVVLKEMSQVYFSTFESIEMTPDSAMHRHAASWSANAL
jgi:hypothetical protein